MVAVKSAQEMETAVLKASEKADALLMAAAVADFRPKQAAEEKIKRAKGTPSVELVANPDILLAVGERRERSDFPRFVAGFAAESQDLKANARAKLEAKGVDLMVANDISAEDAGFEVDSNRVLLLGREGGEEQLELMSKAEVAAIVMGKVVEGLVNRG